MQNHPQFIPNQPIVTPYSPMAPQGYHSTKDNYRRHHRNAPLPPRRNRHHPRGRVLPQGKHQSTIPPYAALTTPLQYPLIQSPAISPRQGRASTRGGPTDDDVVCFTILSRKQSKGIVAIQPNSTHQGNLQFCAMVQEHARSSHNVSSNKEQKRIAQTIKNELQSRGGKFLVWVKVNPNLLVHRGNGSWQTVDEDNALNICRYVLLKQIEQMESKSTRNIVEKNSPPIAFKNKEAPIRKPPGFENDVAPKKAYESGYSTAASSCNISTDTISNVISDMDAEDDENDLWSMLPAGDDKETKISKPQLEGCCWEYKLLPPPFH